MADDIRNTEQTELDFEAQVAAVIKYVPITDKKKPEIKQMIASDPTMQILKHFIVHDWPETIKSCKNYVKPNFNHITEFNI